jgi:hypothetical protein
MGETRHNWSVWKEIPGFFMDDILFYSISCSKALLGIKQSLCSSSGPYNQRENRI